MHLQICLAPRTVCGCSPDAVCRGRIPKAGGPPPAFGGVFLPRFFLRYRRKNRAPGGRKQACLEEIRIRKPPTTPASKLALCVVNASAAASGLLTRPDNGCSHKSAWHPVQCAAAAPTPYQGWVLRAGAPALSGVFLSILFLRRRRKNMASGGRQPVSLVDIKKEKLSILARQSNAPPQGRGAQALQITPAAKPQPPQPNNGGTPPCA